IVKYKTKTLTQDIDTTLATKAGTGLEWDTDNKKFTLTSNVAITSNLTINNNVGIGTNIPSAPLHIYDTSSTSDIFKASNTEITINRSIIPESNNTVDIGSAERKIRDMYISDNSLWIGDDHKLAITSDGTMKFRKRNKAVLPKVLSDASGTNEAAIDHVNNAYGTSFTDISQLKLDHVLSYAKTFNPEYKISDIFGDDIDDYELDTAADAWQINSSKIFLGTNYTNIGIGTNNPDPYFKLDVLGNVKANGSISANDITIKGTTEKGSGAIKLNCELNSHSVSIKGPPHNDYLQNYTLTLPSTAPLANKVLSTDESGNLSWVTYRLDNLNMVEQNQISIDNLKALLGIGTSTYEITDISPAYFNLTTSGD
ncbi:hypothetical protein EB169_12815, partial [archaeon]|nr:hypothetical protein [archaeon]